MNLTAILLVAAMSTDVRAVHATLDRYVAAWLANDESAVMALLSPDSVLIPGEKRALESSAAIRQYWFPPGSAKTVVTKFTNRIDDVEVSGDLAVARGTQTIEWTTAGESWRTHGNYMTVLRRTTSGWTIAVQMAGNTPAERLP